MLFPVLFPLVITSAAECMRFVLTINLSAVNSSCPVVTAPGRCVGIARRGALEGRGLHSTCAL